MLNGQCAAQQYRLDFQTFFNEGPTDWIPFEEIKKMGLRGQIKAETLVLKEGLEHWVYARDLPEINELLEAHQAIVAKETKAAAREGEAKKQAWLAEMERRQAERQAARTAARERFTKDKNSNGILARLFNWLSGRRASQEGQASDHQSTENGSQPPETRNSGLLYLVRLTFQGITYAKVGITRHSADVRYAGHDAIMEVVNEWELPCFQIAQTIEQDILRKFRHFRGAAPDSMDGYTEAFAIEHEAALREEAIRLIALYTESPTRSQDLINELANGRRDRKAIKKAIGKGGQRLKIEYRDAGRVRKSMYVTVKCLNGGYLRVYDHHDASNLERSIPISKIVAASLFE